MVKSKAELEPGRRSRLLAEFVERGSGAAEFRRTADNIVQGHVERGRRGLAMCGAAAGTGVSFVTAGLALTLARAGLNVLILDANLRDPAMEELIEPALPPEGGLLQVLNGELQEAAAITATEATANLSVMYAGGRPETGVAELFDAEVFERVMRYCMRSYELVLVDTPPANRCAETRRIAAVTGYAAVVARRDRSFADDLTTLVKDLRTNRVEIIGTIFNEG